MCNMCNLKSWGVIQKEMKNIHRHRGNAGCPILGKWDISALNTKLTVYLCCTITFPIFIKHATSRRLLVHRYNIYIKLILYH